MGVPFIPLASAATAQLVVAATVLLPAWAMAQHVAPLTWARVDEACPAFLHSAREVIAVREADAEGFEIGDVRFEPGSRVRREGIDWILEATPFVPERWSFRLASDKCVAIGSTGAARAMSPDAVAAYRQKAARLAKAEELLGAMQAAMDVQDRAAAYANAEGACRERREALGSEHALVASCEVQLATRALFHARYDEALELATRAHRSFAATPPGARGVDALAARAAQAQAFYFLSRPAEMHAAAVEAYEGRQRLLGPLHADTIVSQGNVAIALRRLGRLDESIPIYEDVAAKQAQVHGPASLDALRAKSNLSAAFQQRGDWDRVLALQTEIYHARLATRGPTHEATLTTTRDLAEALWDAGKATEALELAERVLPLFSTRFGVDSPQSMPIKTLLGVIYIGLGRTEEALPLFREVHEVTRRTFGDAHRATALAARNLADALMNVGRADEAVAVLDHALAKLPTGARSDPATERELQQARAYALLRQGNSAEALRAFETILAAHGMSAEEVSRATPDQLAEATGWAQAQFESGRQALAVDAMETLYRASQSRFGAQHSMTLEAMATLASMAANAGRTERALELLGDFVERTERLVREGVVASAVNRGRLVQSVRERPYVAGYRTYVRLLAARDPLRALEVAELTKGRSLAETLSRPAMASPDLQAARVQFALAEERVALSDIGSAPYLKAVAERSKAERDLRAAMGPALTRGSPLDVRETLRRVIAPGTVFVHLVVSGNRVVALTSNHTAQVRARDLGEIPGLADTVEAFRRASISASPGSERLWAMPDGSVRWSLARPAGATRLTDWARAGRDLSRRILEPIAGELGPAKNWIISPDGALAFLPFEALPFGRQAVIETRTVRYTPSLASLALMPAMVSAGSRHDFLGVGVSRFDHPSAAWRDLPRAEEEVNAIAPMFRDARVLAGASATERRLRELDAAGELRRYRYLHFATHAFLSRRGPSLSGVVMAADAADPADGIITAAEWPTYRLRSDLVVLSACDTGLGSIVAGEGVVGLPHALLSAGSRAVVLTLWSVPDSSAAEFMPRFYKRLLSGKPAAEALRETKLEFARSKGPWSSPRHWAPYVLYGAT